MLQQQGNTKSGLSTKQPQNANAVVMVPPKEFQYNVETAQDNEFQQPLNLDDAQIRQQALAEYRQMVETLQQQGVQVIEFDYPLSSVATPDAVFPNNWFSTTADGGFYTFPMASFNRREEVRVEALTQALQAAGRHVQHHVSFESYLTQQAYLESTGVMVIDHPSRTIYAALSQRCDQRVLEAYAQQIEYPNVIAFHTALPSGQPIYHTNVMMSIGEHFCVICDEVISELDRHKVLSSLQKEKQVITITLDQMNQFCANILQLETAQHEKVIAMSQSAFSAFSAEQRAQLAQHGTLIPLNVQTIETIGGGSVRCMLGEVFLPTSTLSTPILSTHSETD